MKILITGAHFTPALAVIEQLKKTYNADILYVGRKTTMEGDQTESAESQILPRMEIKFIPITAGRLQRSFTIHTIPSLLKIPLGFIQAIFIILQFRPDVVLSFGGYVAVPTVLASWLFSIPIIIHEQTLVMGLTNRISALFADKIAVSFKENMAGAKTILTGNPIRQSVLSPQGVNLTHPGGGLNGLKPPIVLITGGSQGSHIINQTVEEVLDELTKMATVVHISGENKFGDYERLSKKQNEKYIVRKWLGKEWGALLSITDLVVSRGGINTLMELAYLTKPALVIPIPYLYQDEQNKNAHFFQELGLVKSLPQSKLSGKTLLENIKVMLKDLDNLKRQALGAKQVVSPDAAKMIALETVLLCRQK